MRNRNVFRSIIFLCLLLILVSSSLVGYSNNGSSDNAAAQKDSRSIKDIVQAIAHKQIHQLSDGEYKKGTWDEVMTAKRPEGLMWIYPWGVSLYGMLRESEVTGDKPSEAFVLKHNEMLGQYYQYLQWQVQTFSQTQKEELARAINNRTNPLGRVMRASSLDDTGAMASQMLEGILRHKAKIIPEQKELLKFIADYIFTKQSRLPDGTFWRPEADKTLWIDDLYMSCPFLVRWYEFTGDRKYLDDAANQVIGMAKRQQDKDGVWFHANFIGEGKTDIGVPNGFKWGRANGWAMVSTVEVLSAMPKNHPKRAELLSILRRHIDGIKPLQTESGMWRQVLDQKTVWEETSCTAMFTYSIARAVRRGWISKSYLKIAQKAFAGLSRNVTEDGQVNETSEGTNIGRDMDYYTNRRRPPNDFHGPGPVMLAGAELIQAEKK